MVEPVVGDWVAASAGRPGRVETAEREKIVVAGRFAAAQIVPGRHTAAYEGDLVVFLIGMRVNRWRALRHWPRIFRAMGPMINDLSSDPTSGLLGFRVMFGWREVTLVQYWRDSDSLQAFAGDPAGPHRPAWLDYFRGAHASAAVGVWHETYVVAAGGHESIFLNMPRTGLGAVGGVVPVGRRGDSFGERLSRARS